MQNSLGSIKEGLPFSLSRQEWLCLSTMLGLLKTVFFRTDILIITATDSFISYSLGTLAPVFPFLAKSLGLAT